MHLQMMWDKGFHFNDQEEATDKFEEKYYDDGFYAYFYNY